MALVRALAVVEADMHLRAGDAENFLHVEVGAEEHFPLVGDALLRAAAHVAEELAVGNAVQIDAFISERLAEGLRGRVDQGEQIAWRHRGLRRGRRRRRAGQRRGGRGVLRQLRRTDAIG